MRRIGKRVFAVILVFVLFVSCGKIWRYILIDDTKSYTRLTMHQLYHPEKNIDIAFIGSSHVYVSLVPEITDQGFGKYTFNLGTSAQRMDGSLAMAKEVIAHHDVSQIYLEVYYGMATNKDRTQLTSTYIISDYMKPSFRKLSYILKACPKDYWVNSFIIARREWTKFFDADYIKDMVKKKSSDSYRNYEWVREEGQVAYYVDRGFATNESTVPEDVLWNESAYNKIDMDNISDNWKDSLNDIVELCKDKGVKLTFFITPIPEWTIVGKGNYDVYVQLVRTIADEADVELYDFNLVKPEFFPAGDGAYFKDESHLNTSGAKAFSELFCDVFNGKISGEDLFFDSLEDKMMYEEPIVYGLAGPFADEKEGVKYARMISNRDSGIEYRITTVSEDGNSKIIQDFSENKDFELPVDEHGILTVAWRLKNASGNTTTLQTVY